MFELFDMVRVKKEYPELSLTPKHIGTIVDVHNGGEAYTVEFIDENGDTIEKALYTEFAESELKYVPPKLDGGSLEKITRLDEKLNIEESLSWAKEFLGLKPEQSFQDIDVDDKDYICRNNRYYDGHYKESEFSLEEIEKQLEEEKKMVEQMTEWEDL